MKDITGIDDEYKNMIIESNYHNMTEKYETNAVAIQVDDIIILSDSGSIGTRVYIDGVLQTGIYELNININVNGLPTLEIKRYCFGENN